MGSEQDGGKHEREIDFNAEDVDGCVHVLWENDIGILLQDTSYKLAGVRVSVYGGVRYMYCICL